MKQELEAWSTWLGAARLLPEWEYVLRQWGCLPSPHFAAKGILILAPSVVWGLLPVPGLEPPGGIW